MRRAPRKYSKDFRISLSLAEPEDEAIIRFLETAPWGDRARVVRDALRLYWKDVTAAQETIRPGGIR